MNQRLAGRWMLKGSPGRVRIRAQPQLQPQHDFELEGVKRALYGISRHTTWLAPRRVANQLWAAGLPCVREVTPARYNASTAASTAPTGTKAHGTTARRSERTWGGKPTGRRTAVVEAATVEEGAEAAVQLAVGAAGELNGAPSTTPSATAIKSVSRRRSTATAVAPTSLTFAALIRPSRR